MSKENQAEMFIRFLREALEEDRLKGTQALALKRKERIQRLLQLQRPDMSYAMAFTEPLDCIQLMAASDHDRHKS